MKQYRTEIGHSPARRRVLLAAPFAAAAAAVAAAPAFASVRSESAVGVLLPRHEHIPGLTLDWRLGFQAELIAAQSSLRPVFLPYAVGSHRALAAAQSLLDQGCSTLTGIFSRNLAGYLKDELAAHNASFIVSDFGANAIRPSAICERISRVGPNLWQHAYFAGQHAAQHGAITAVVATSFYEAGYDLPGAFKQGFVDGGGQSVALVVTGTPELPAGDDGFSRITAALDANVRPVDVLFSLYSGREASRYLRFAPSLATRVGGMLALSPLLHGMPAQTFAGLPLTVANAHAAGVSRAGESVYTAMGRVAAQSVLAAGGASCNTEPAWTLSFNHSSTASLGAMEHRAARALVNAAIVPWQGQSMSGWMAPYGA